MSLPALADGSRVVPARTNMTASSDVESARFQVLSEIILCSAIAESVRPPGPYQYPAESGGVLGQAEYFQKIGT